MEEQNTTRLGHGFDVAAIRAAAANMEEGAVTGGYSADREAVIQMLNDALATELVCVMRYKRHYYTIGGLGTPWGPLVAAAVLVPAGELLRGKLGGILPGLHYFLYGVLIVIVVLTSPEGLVPRLATLFRAASKRRGRGETP